MWIVWSFAESRKLISVNVKMLHFYVEVHVRWIICPRLEEIFNGTAVYCWDNVDHHMPASS